MPTEIKARLRDDGSGGVGGLLTGEHELCALSYDPSDDPTEVIVLVKNEEGNELSSDPPLSDDSLPSDVPNGSSQPMVDKSSSPPKKMPEKALALGGLKDNLLSGNNSKGKTKENASPQKGRNDGSCAASGFTKAALFESGGGGGSEGQFGTNSVSTTASVINDVPHATTKRVRSDIENENGPLEKCSKDKYCSWEGCKNGAIKGGVCWRHGAKSTTNKKKCSSEGCTKYAQKGGLCGSHGTKVESALLSKHTSALIALLRQTAAKGEKRVPESLLNPVREETMAALRGAGFILPRFRALQEAENNAILLYTREIEHQQIRLQEAMHGGAENEGQRETKAMLVACASGNNATLPTAAATSKRPRCDNENEKRPPAKKQYRYECTADGCTNWAILGGVCWRHGAKNKKKCSTEGCTNYAVNEGVCRRHGAKVTRKLCSKEGCKSQAQTRGVCMKHGAQRKQCSAEGCTNQIQKGGVCWRHGAKDLMKKA